MKKVLCFLGAAIYGGVFAYLLCFLFHLITPWIMSWGWIAVILYWLFALGLITSLFRGLSSILFIPLYYLISKCKIAKYIPILFLSFFGYSAIAFPWNIGIEYSFLKIVIAFSLSSTAFALFVTFIMSIWSFGDYESLQDYVPVQEEELDDDGLPVNSRQEENNSNLPENQVENETLSPAGENIISPYEVPDAITEVNPAPEPIQEQKSALPVDEKGNILYHKMSVENTIADLTDGTLDDNEIDGFIAANKAEAGKLLKKVSESAPKISTNKAKYLTDKKAWQEKVADAQARVDYWNFIDERKVFYQSAKVGDEKNNKIQVKKRVENTFANPIMKKESPTKRKERNIFSIVALIFISCIIVVTIVFHAINGENSYRESENKMLVYRDSIRRADSIIALEAAAAEAAMDLSNPKDGIDELYEMMLQHYSSDSLKPKSEFRKWASDENNRKELYQAFKEDCPDIFSSQSEFDKYLGF